MRPRWHLSASGPALALALAVACSAPPPAQPPAQGPSAAPPAAPEHTVTLLYVDGPSGLLAPCEASLPLEESAEARYSVLMARYLEGPPCAGLVSPFVERTELRAVYLLPGGGVVVDLSGQAASGGGASTEVARVYGIVDTLKINFPEITSVRILVDGREMESLLGHIDLLRSIPPETSVLSPSARALIRSKLP